MAGQSKDFWLETAIQDFIDLLGRQQNNALTWVKDRQNRHKVIGGAIIGSGLFFTLYKLQQHYKKKKKVKESTKVDGKKSSQPGMGKPGINKEFFGKLAYLIRLGLPQVKSKEMLTVIALTLVVIFQSFLVNHVNSVAGDLMKYLVMQNVDQYLKTLAIFTGLNLVTSFVSPSLTYLMDLLAVDFRRNITRHIHSKYYENIIYYKVKNLDKRITNSDQIITQDVEVLSEKISSLFVDFLSPLTDVIIYSIKMTETIGVGGPIWIFIYLLTAFSILQFVTPNFTKMSAEVQAREGKFRYIHARTKINAESIAFYQGDHKERAIIESIFKELTDYSNYTINKNFIFGIVNDYFTKYCPHTVTLVIGGMPVFFGRLRQLSKGELMSTLRYLVAVVSYEFLAVGKLIELFRILMKLSGYTQRVYYLLSVMKDIYMKQKTDKTILGTFENSENIEFNNVSIVTPANVPLAHKLEFAIRRGSNTVITGPNGAGKSSLFRVLGGLWPLRRGVVKKPGAGKSGLYSEIFYLPQKPYNVIGSLRDQIIYPDIKSKRNDEELQKLLDTFGIGYLSKNHREGFDGKQDWDKLSRGEQQRLAMSRLFYHQPSYAILDECTSCINKDAEEKLYNQCKEKNITCITISHRPALNQFHDYRLVFDGDGGWSYEKIDHDNVVSYEDDCESTIISSYRKSEQDDADVLAGRK